MKAVAKFLHGVYRTGVKIFLSIGYDFYTWKEEELPCGPKLFVSNHFSSSDAHFVTTLMKDPLHMVIGPGFNVPILRHYLKWTEQVSANTKEIEFHKGAARIYLETGVPVIPVGLIAPMRRMKKKNSSFVGHTMTVVSRNYYANIGRAMTFENAMRLAQTDRAKAEEIITEKIKQEVQFLIDDIKQNKFWS